MDPTLTAISRTLGQDVDALNLISQNVANMQTPGFRAEHLVRNFAGGVRQDVTRLDLADGALKRTGGPLDLALQGNAFFAIDLGGGQMALTRDGQFHLDAQGSLVDAAGHAVLGESGPVTSSDRALKVLPNGEIQDAGRTIDHLRIVVVAEPQKLHDIGDGLYAYEGASSPWAGALQVGAIEQANVDPGREMVHLMEVTRHSQSLQHALRAYDEAMQTGINHLGDNG